MSKRKPMIALLIAGHNEEKVIKQTLLSAISAGLAAEHIYVVDDNSNDRTSDIAREVLAAKNVMKVKRSGKGLALTKAANHFQVADHYRWIHIADADGGFAPNYFRVLRRELRVKNAAATGYITSAKNSMVGQYRVIEYTLGMEIVRRFQTFGRVISVVPGPSSCFRADVFKKLSFGRGALAEDFCVTLQIHREKLGPIQFIEDAQVFTQDPQTFRDFVRQIKRWNLGTLQGMQLYKVGLRPNRIDAYLNYQIAQNLLMFFTYAVWIPFITFRHHKPEVVAVAFMVDISMMAAMTALVAARAKRWDIMGSFPNLYAMRWVSLGVFMWAFMQTYILRRYRLKPGNGIWQPVERKVAA